MSLSEISMIYAKLVACPVCAMPADRACISKAGRPRSHGPHYNRALNALPATVKLFENFIVDQQKIVSDAQSELDKVNAQILALSETI